MLLTLAANALAVATTVFAAFAPALFMTRSALALHHHGKVIGGAAGGGASGGGPNGGGDSRHLVIARTPSSFSRNAPKVHSS